VFAEIDAYARRQGARADTFAGLAGTGDLVATIIAQGNGEATATGESADALALLAHAIEVGGHAAPAVAGLAAVVEGRADAGDWASTITAPEPRRRFVRAA
jgi:glycerol-3-phosphate dehydrogenase